MNVLFWTDAFLPDIGGLEVFCRNLVRELTARGHRCLVITNRDDDRNLGEMDFEGVPVHGFPFRRSLHRGDLKEILRWHEASSPLIDAFAPDVIHLHGITRSLFHFTRQQRRRRLPAVITLHDNVVLHGHSMAIPVLANVDGVVAISEYIRAESLENHPGIKPRLRTILNALPPLSSPTVPAPGNQRILALGRMTDQKGFDLAIRAITDVSAEFPRATLTLAGDGPERKALENLSAKLRAPVRFAGWVKPDDVPALIDAHDAMLVPSRWQEPFGLVALQAGMRARPVIVSRRGGLPETVLDGQTGLVVESENRAGFAAALRRLLADPALGERLGQAAHARVTDVFRFDRMVDAYERVYEDARLARRAAAP